MEKVTRDKVRGAFLGCAIGDALGMPVETLKPDDIARVYPETGGRVTTYLEPHDHKWFKGTPAGTTTDDWQLTMATAAAMIDKPWDMDTQARYHVAALDASDMGWGGSTRSAVRSLANNVHWKKSGEWENGRGRGNGVVMKILPLVVYYMKWKRENYGEVPHDIYSFLLDLTAMTHRTRLAMLASVAHFCTLHYAFIGSKDPKVLRTVFRMAYLYVTEDFCRAHYQGYDELPAEQHDILTRLHSLSDWDTLDFSKPTDLFGGGSSYVYDSLPFTYAYFLRNPDTIDSLYDCVSAGGDADSNGSMLATMLGARNGASIFPAHLTQGLTCFPAVMALAEDLCEYCGIPE